MGKKYRLLFIQASQYNTVRPTELLKQKRLYLPGLVFPLLAAMTPDHYDVQVKLEVIDDIDFDADVDLVGIGTMGPTLFRGIEIADEFRKRGKKVFMGGYMLSMVPELAAPHVDSMIIGDAEISYPMLLRDFEKGKMKRVYNYPVDKLEGLPVPRYELLTEKKIGYMLPVQAARGCPHTCSFCSIACVYRGRYMSRPIDEVVNDIKRVKEVGYRRIFFVDDNIFGNPRYFDEFCEKITPLDIEWSSQCTINIARRPEMLKKAAASGCKTLSFGLETITQEGIDRLNKKWLKVSDHEMLLKRVRDAGIMIYCEILVGTDSDTEESIRATSDFLKRTKVALPRPYILTPLPGTALYDEYKKKGKLRFENILNYSGSTAVHYPEKITPEKLEDMYRWLQKDVYSLGHILSRTVFHRGILSNPGYHLFALATNLIYRSYIRRGEVPDIF